MKLDKFKRFIRKVFYRRLTINCVMNTEKGEGKYGPYKIAKGDSFSLNNEAEGEKFPFLTIRYEPRGRKVHLTTWSDLSIQKRKGWRK